MDRPPPGTSTLPSRAVSGAGDGAALLEQTLPRAQAKLAAYYQRGLTPAADAVAYTTTVAEPRRHLDPRLAAELGLDPNMVPSLEQRAQLLVGSRR